LGVRGWDVGDDGGVAVWAGGVWPGGGEVCANAWPGGRQTTKMTIATRHKYAPTDSSVWLDFVHFAFMPCSLSWYRPSRNHATDIAYLEKRRSGRSTEQHIADARDCVLALTTAPCKEQIHHR
jgi:hypothetical protein